MDRDILDRAISLYQAGKSFKSISNEIGLNVGTLFREFKREGVPTRTHGGKNPINIALASELYESGLSLQEVANRLGYSSENAIAAIFRKNNIPIRTKAGVPDTVNHAFFSKIDTEEKAYFVGLILADGNITPRGKSQPAIRLELQKQDKHVLESFKNCIQTSNHITSSRNCYRIAVHSTQIASDLAKYGIVPRKTGNKQFMISDIPEMFQRDFIRGFFDGNGWITYSKRIWTIGFADGELFLTELRDYFCSRLNVYKVAVIEHGGCFMISFSSQQDTRNILHFMYDNATLYLNRKYQKMIDCIGNTERD